MLRVPGSVHILAQSANVVCPQCGSWERHRLLWYVQSREQLFSPDDDVLHFTAEPIREVVLSRSCGDQAADLDPASGDRVIDIEQIDLPDDSVGTVICSHVLEHVNDRQALSEIYRILRPGGRRFSWCQSPRV